MTLPRGHLPSHMPSQAPHQPLWDPLQLEVITSGQLGSDFGDTSGNHFLDCWTPGCADAQLQRFSAALLPRRNASQLKHGRTVCRKQRATALEASKSRDK